MAKAVVQTLEEVPEALRSEYEPHEGRFRLKIDGDPVGYVPTIKHLEFRENNVRLMRALGVDSVDAALARAAALAGIDPAKAARLKDVDPDEYAALKAESEKLKGKGVSKADDLQALITSAVEKTIAPLRTQLETSEKARQQAQDRADDSLLRETIGAKYLKAGGRPEVAEFIVSKAKESFRVDSGQVKAIDGKLSPTATGAALSVDEWMTQTTNDYGFAFEASKGGGASPATVPVTSNGAGARTGVKRLVNPSPEDLGRLEFVKGKGLVDPFTKQPIEIVNQ